MDPTELIQAIIGPYGALVLAVIAVVVLWRKLEASQEGLERQQELFDKALDIIKEDLVPLVQELSKRPRRVG